MDPLGQVFLQLGLAGALLFVSYRLWDKALDRQAVTDAARTKMLGESEAARTKAIADGFATITGALQAHAAADLESHAEMIATIAEFKGRLDGVLDMGDRFTPPPVEVPTPPAAPRGTPNAPRSATTPTGTIPIPVIASERTGPGRK